MVNQGYLRERNVPTLSATDVPGGSNKAAHRLLTIEQTAELLSLSMEEVRQLIATRQLTDLWILGHERIDLRDVNGLIEMYRRTATRRADSLYPDARNSSDFGDATDVSDERKVK